jgi:Arm DNA-binding domain
MPNITKKAIDTGKRPAKGQTFVWDTALIGFGMRLTPGAVSFIAESRIQGVKRRMTIGRYPVMSVEEAREKAREFLSLMANGVDPTLQRRTDRVASITLKEVMEIYLARKEPKATTVDVYRRQCHHAFKEWMDKPVTFITRDMVEDKHREMTNGTRRNGNSGRAYANGCFTTLQALLNFAGEKFTVDGQSLIPVNPVSRLTKTRAWYRVHPRTGVVPEHKIGAWCDFSNSFADFFARYLANFFELFGNRIRFSELLVDVSRR